MRDADGSENGNGDGHWLVSAGRVVAALLVSGAATMFVTPAMPDASTRTVEVSSSTHGLAVETRSLWMCLATPQRTN